MAPARFMDANRFYPCRQWVRSGRERSLDYGVLKVGDAASMVRRSAGGGSGGKGGAKKDRVAPGGFPPGAPTDPNVRN